MCTPRVIAGLRAVVLAPHDVVGRIDGAVVVEVARQVGHRVETENALRAVSETGPEDELAQVVEPTLPAVAVARGRQKFKSLGVRKSPGATSNCSPVRAMSCNAPVASVAQMPRSFVRSDSAADEVGAKRSLAGAVQRGVVQVAEVYAARRAGGLIAAAGDERQIVRLPDQMPSLLDLDTGSIEVGTNASWPASLSTGHAPLRLNCRN